MTWLKRIGILFTWLIVLVGGALALLFATALSAVLVVLAASVLSFAIIDHHGTSMF